MLFKILMILTVFTSLIFNALGMPIAPGSPPPKTRSGRATWYYVGRGSCGQMNTNSDLIVAIAQSIYGNGDHCNKYIKITDASHTAVAMVRDTCPSCQPGDLDMSPALFQHFKNLSDGTFNMSWSFL